MILLAQERREFCELHQQNKTVIKKHPTLSCIDVSDACLLKHFVHKMRTVLETIEKGFMFVSGAELTADVPHGIVIIQG